MDSQYPSTNSILPLDGSGAKPQPPTMQSTGLDYPSPEQPIPGSTSLLRRMPYKARVFFTAEGRELRRVTGIFFRLVFNLGQIVAITVILALSHSRFQSKSDPIVSEFEASKMLGIWNALWAVRATFGCGMIVWEWKRYLDKRRREQRLGTADVLLKAVGLVDKGDLQPQWGTEVQSLSRRAPVPNANSAPIPNLNMPSSLQNQDRQPTSFVEAFTPPHPDPALSSRLPRRNSPSREHPSGDNTLFDRLDTMLTAMGLVHFVVNHIWLFTTVHTCRINNPHVWYLGLAIASLGYLIVLELLLIAIIVFVLGPILLLTLNLVMLCLGRPVDRHGNVIVRAEIPKIEQGLIDKIPLVVYIPPLESELRVSEEPTEESELPTHNAKDSKNPVEGIGLGEATATGKPRMTSSTTRPHPTRNRFAWFRRGDGKGKARNLTLRADAISDGDPRFEKGEHPFVVLESNRATCFICLDDFAEPKRKKTVPVPLLRPKTLGPIAATGEDQGSSLPMQEGDEIERDSPTCHTALHKESTQEDTAEPPLDVSGEPLRLLACGHVFHKYCLDPWLSRTSGRCPVCNRKVEILK